MMNNLLSPQNLKNFFNEIYFILKSSNLELNEVWIKEREIDFLQKISNHYSVKNFIQNFSFLKCESWNHISIDKIHFILDTIGYIDKDIKNLAEILDFRGFESLIGEILQKNGYKVIKNFRFSDKSDFKCQTKQKRYEIDVIGLKNHFLLLIDGKQWRKKDSYSTLNKSAEKQFQRAVALNKNKYILSGLLEKLANLNTSFEKYLPIKVIPLMVTLEENDCKFSNIQVPLVSVYRLNSFLQEYQLILNYLKYIEIKKLSFQKKIL
ncbi:MAG: hypothetical protein P8Y70_07600 [Candidatus Lokiarchaeota archaeon]